MWVTLGVTGRVDAVGVDEGDALRASFQPWMAEPLTSLPGALRGLSTTGARGETTGMPGSIYTRHAHAADSADRSDAAVG